MEYPCTDYPYVDCPGPGHHPLPRNNPANSTQLAQKPVCTGRAQPAPLPVAARAEAVAGQASAELGPSQGLARAEEPGRSAEQAPPLPGAGAGRAAPGELAAAPRLCLETPPLILHFYI